ncbi:MAG: peptidase S8 [Candidatus Parabeggiatoa sp. nov. 2]|nr:MAG: hypothetical protein B6247_04090 [Beggiatoa sp. 4572_84]RKZ60616.1 MAG: peptidase S8 [Gammaproteobacteria bacterium]HEC85383.1 peptidase S8 [Thioploca sp.]
MPVFVKRQFFVKTPKRLSSFSVALCVAVSGIFPHDALSSGTKPAPSYEHNCTHPNYVLASHTKIYRIVVKFHEGSGIRFRAGALKVEEIDKAEISRSLPQFNPSLLTEDLRRITETIRKEGHQIQPLFKVDEAKLAELNASGERQSGHRLADLRLYYEITHPVKGATYNSVVNMLTDLNRLKSVEIAYAEPIPELAVVSYSVKEVSPADFTPTPNFEEMQAYLDSPPFGIGARDCAWTVQGGRGSGVKIVDVEVGWNTTHEDLPALFFTHGTPVSWGINHGTAVLGEIAAVNNGFGITGIISNAKVGYASACSPQYGDNCFPEDEEETDFNVANAILEAANGVGEGGIVLIELEFPGPKNSSPCTCNKEQCGDLPVEYWPASFDAIHHATTNGVTVVEAGGNGSSNLDDPVYDGCFDRQVRDSGAILVAATDEPTLGVPACWTNWGSRIDVHGWGSNVTTLAYGTLFNGGDNDENRYYIANFGGTSSASPIVVGAAGSAQGVAMARHGQPLEPLHLRELLVSTGTPQPQPINKKIGPLPNLCNLIPQIEKGAVD